MQWYYAINGERKGPVNQAEFERLVQVGTITRDSLVWRKPMAGWQSLAEVLAADPAAVVILEPEVPPLPGELLGELAGAGVGGPVDGPAVRVTHSGPIVYGGFWLRVAARLIDTFILWVGGQMFIGVVGVLFFRDTMAMLEKLKGRQPTPEQAMEMLGFVGVAIGISLILGVAYDCFFLRKYSATPGKLAMGLVVRRADGSPLSIGRIIGRYFALALNMFTLGLSYLVVAFDDEKRGVHDYVCDTRVVRPPR
ncbi:MAG: RDD family protein [Opitutaceae bacterium]|jgi:uncharacterized RDD family membrane protein YckC